MNLKTSFAALALLGAVVAGGAPAQPVPTPAAATATKAPPVPLLWKASRGDDAVYLLGTFHLLRPDDYPVAAEVDAALEASQRLVLELDPAEMNSPTLGLKMAQAGMRTDGTPLDSELPPETAKALQTWLAGNAVRVQPLGLTAQSVQMFEPWFIALTVTLVEMTGHGLDPSLGLDSHLAQRAAQAGKETRGLETGEAQIAFLDGMHRPEQLQFLREALESSGEKGARELDKLHGAWREGDERTLWNEMAVSMRTEYPALYHRINVARNDAWLPEIEALFKQPGESLVAVGALHLLGEDGVVHKLRQRGYTVERVEAAAP
ncbi:TraB/GumN family protein [Luteimonas yindakuii]|uniref:TraB/GumN family protein n=1 Tax=Luteimonas yindakuii TaxID=2565782 RepID=A0A4Z1RBX2_9GAMM|nr:TraB/GumN family protein [Luteimonas yindakuii]TKS54278.1 TraB/GumN family protein [Luteimonas yindakuii]